MYQDDSLPKYEYIDILRGVATLCVLAVHSHQELPGLGAVFSALINYGQLGVQLFFVASSLTLCLSMMHRHELTLRNFYIRRFFRIAPLYYFGIVIYLIWRVIFDYITTGLWGVPQGYSPLAVIENLLFIHGFHPANFNFIVPGGWSIATEVAFYSVFPALLIFLRRQGLARFILLGLGIVAVSFVIQYVAIYYVQPPLLASGRINHLATNDEFGYMYALILNQVSVFMIGMMAFHLREQRVGKGLIGVALLLMLASCLLQNDRSHDTGFDGMVYPIMTSIAFGILATRLAQGAVPDNPATRFLMKVGQYSFSMYLTHFMLLDMLRLVFRAEIYPLVEFPELRFALLYATLVAVTFVVAGLTNRYVELPGIAYGKQLIARRRTVAA